MLKKQRIYDYFSEFASEALHIVIFENFVRSMSCLSKLKVTPSFCFAFKISDYVTATNIWLHIMYQNKEGFKKENFITHIFKQSAQAADVVQCAVGAGSSSCTQSKSMSSSCTRPTSWSSIGPRITSRNTLQHSLVWKSFHFYFQSCQYTSYFQLNRVSVILDQIESFRVKLCQICKIDF